MEEWVRAAPSRSIRVQRYEDVTVYVLREAPHSSKAREFHVAAQNGEHPEMISHRVEQGIAWMDCGHACAYTDPYGWVPECGCPVHDDDPA